jgi:hypothetical protein
MKLHGMRLQFVSISLIVVAIGARPLQAQSDHMHQLATESKSLTQAQGALLQIVKSSTVRFKGVSAAEAEGYHLAFGCVTGPDAGAMGLHYVKMPLVVDPPMMPNGEPDPTQPQIVIYEPLPDGGLHLIGADYLILADPWEQAHPMQGAPQMMGQLFHYFEAPNRFGLPAFYTLHVWAWKENPNGAFVNWHPNVSCASFSGQTQ